MANGALIVQRPFQPDALLFQFFPLASILFKISRYSLYRSSPIIRIVS